jgi:hypothetical protein
MGSSKQLNAHFGFKQQLPPHQQLQQSSLHQQHHQQQQQQRVQVSKSPMTVTSPNGRVVYVVTSPNRYKASNTESFN